MEHNMILSASGWRKIFAESSDEKDFTRRIGEDNSFLCILIAETFAEYVAEKSGKKNPAVVVATDTRPTGKEIAQKIIEAFCVFGVKTIFLGVAAAPEIMAYSKKFDGFVYISASHNPVGHNGIKFGLKNGGVLCAEESKILANRFEEKCRKDGIEEHALSVIVRAEKKSVEKIFSKSRTYKKKSLDAYKKFIRTVISGSEKKSVQRGIFSAIKKSLSKKSMAIACDMNGSARTLSIDKKFFSSCGIKFVPFNDEPGKIVHEIIPEPENLIYCAEFMNDLHGRGMQNLSLGFMPDCDGDRGNVVFWNEKKNSAQTIAAQEVFALCVMAELAFEYWKNPRIKNLAVAVNCPTSMRVDEICGFMNAEIFRAEVGEANVVNLAAEKRSENFNVRIFGEGSNGGNITFPSCVRDPLATIFALIKILSIRDEKNKIGLFHIWCRKSNQEEKYRNDFTLNDVISTLPQFVTTGVSESRAILKVKMRDKGKLKENFKKQFELAWQNDREKFFAELGIFSYGCFLTNGTREIRGEENWNNGNGGLKIKFFDAQKNPSAFIWMRPSGTEAVFRILCDVKGSDREKEKKLLAWESDLIKKSDE